MLETLGIFWFVHYAARCIARREALLFEVEREGVASSRRFLSETRTDVEEADVVSLLRLLDQVGDATMVRQRNSVRAGGVASIRRKV